jgi:hypothetical protein
MMKACRKLVLLLAMAVLPLQGAAAALSVLLCHGDAQQHALHAQGGHGHAAHGENQPDQGNSPSPQGYHLCCHCSVSAVEVAMPLPALPLSRTFALAPASLHVHFVPDRPDRPPLA